MIIVIGGLMFCNCQWASMPKECQQLYQEQLEKEQVAI